MHLHIHICTCIYTYAHAYIYITKHTYITQTVKILAIKLLTELMYDDDKDIDRHTDEILPVCVYVCMYHMCVYVSIYAYVVLVCV